MSPQLPSPNLAIAFAPTGVLRATINLGNPILAHEDAATGQVGGVSVDLAQSLAAQLGVPLSPVVFKTASHAVDAVATGQADVGFFAVDPLRGAGVHFTAPYVLIEGCHLVREHAAFRVNADVDQPGVRVAVVGGSAYDLFLTRELKAAALVRFPDAEAGLEAFLKEGLEVMAGIRQPLMSISRPRIPATAWYPTVSWSSARPWGCPGAAPRPPASRCQRSSSRPRPAVSWRMPWPVMAFKVPRWRPRGRADARLNRRCPLPPTTAPPSA